MIRLDTENGDPLNLTPIRGKS